MGRKHTPESKARIAASLSGRRRAVYTSRTCPTCSAVFERPISKTHRFCGKSCASAFISKRENLSDETRERLRQNALTRHAKKDGNIGFQTRSKFKSSFPEQLAEQFFDAANVSYVREKRIGKWFADFVIGTIVVEIDGQQHQKPERKAKDVEKDAFLTNEGFTVIRIPFTAPNESFWKSLEAVKNCLHS